MASNVFSSLWYLHASLIGIAASMTSNFVLNKLWTFEERDFHARKTVVQYGLFLGLSAFGALVQLGMLGLLIESYHLPFPMALIFAVAAAGAGNFILNKKYTFKERIWS
jgi:dolichol-phosphate mannosyltransferase